MMIGYIRVSTQEQNEERQTMLMKEHGVEKIFLDKLSGKDTKRPELNAMISFARAGDVVVVESISRFARNTKDLLNLIELLTEKNVGFVSMKENIDTSTPTGKFMLAVFGAVAELERAYILQRQREGIEVAKEKGIYKGRKKVMPDNFDKVYDKWQRGEVTATAAMRQLNMSKSTFYRRAKEKKQR